MNARLYIITETNEFVRWKVDELWSTGCNVCLCPKFVELLANEIPERNRQKSSRRVPPTPRCRKTDVRATAVDAGGCLAAFLRCSTNARGNVKPCTHNARACGWRLAREQRGRQAPPVKCRKRIRQEVGQRSQFPSGEQRQQMAPTLRMLRPTGRVFLCTVARATLPFHPPIRDQCSIDHIRSGSRLSRITSSLLALSTAFCHLRFSLFRSIGEERRKKRREKDWRESCVSICATRSTTMYVSWFTSRDRDPYLIRLARSPSPSVRLRIRKQLLAATFYGGLMVHSRTSFQYKLTDLWGFRDLKRIKWYLDDW